MSNTLVFLSVELFAVLSLKKNVIVQFLFWSDKKKVNVAGLK